MNVFLVGFGLQFVGHGEHDQVTPGCRFGNAHHLQTFGFGLCSRGRALTQGDNYILGTAVAQVQRMGVALAAVAQNGYFHFLDQVHIAIAIVVDAHGSILWSSLTEAQTTQNWCQVPVN